MSSAAAIGEKWEDFANPPSRLRTTMSPTEELVHDLIDLHAAGRDGDPDRVRKVEDRVRTRVGDGVPKAVAARVLGFSVNTLDKWIARGRVETVAGKNGRRLVALEPLVDLAAQVEEIRATGKKDGLLAAAILALQLKDPEYRREFDELYGESLEAMRKGDLVLFTIPDTFGPED